MMTEKHYEVIVVGGGISGAALLYELARYTDIKNIALVEKYEGLATLNSSYRFMIASTSISPTPIAIF